jgi:hypothetical protein
MKMLALNAIGLRRGLAALAACGLIVAVSQGLAVRAEAEDATPDYVAPLDMTSTYTDPFYARKALGQTTLAGHGTTGIRSEPPADVQANAAASQQDYPEDFYVLGP